MKHFYSPSAFVVLTLFIASRITELQNQKPLTFFSFNKGRVSSTVSPAAVTPFDHTNDQRTLLALR